MSVSEKNDKTLTISVKNPSKHKTGDSTLSSLEDKIHTIKNDLLTIIKVVTVTTVMEDEEYGNEFLSTYENYEKFFKVLIKYNLVDNIQYTKQVFSSNPISCWLELILLCMLALHSFPDNNIVKCEVIADKMIKSDKERCDYGICFTLLANLEAFDWKQHCLSLFIPTDSEKKMKKLLLFDGEVKLFA